MRDRFTDEYGERAKTAIPYAMNASFSVTMGSLMNAKNKELKEAFKRQQQQNQEGDKVQRLKNEVQSVKEVSFSIILFSKTLLKRSILTIFRIFKVPRRLLFGIFSELLGRFSALFL